jgi:MFS family permease
MPSSHPALPHSPRTAWLMVLACTAMVAMGFGAVVNIAVFLLPLGAEFGWTRAELSLAYSIAGIGTGVGGIVMGHYADRLPIRRVVLFGALAPGVAFLLLSQLTSTTELYVYHALMGVLGMGAIMAPMNSLAGQWLARNPGLAIGVVSAGGAFGQGVMPFFARHLVLVQGWRSAYLTLGIAYLLIMVPIALLLRDAPRAPAGTASPAARPPGASPAWLLAWLSVAVLFCCACMATPIVHVASLGADRGLGGQESAGLLAVMMVFGMLGRLAFGRLADRVGNLNAYIVASAGQTGLALLFPMMQTRAELFALSAVFGLVFSGAMTAFILCAREYAPPGRTGLGIGVVMFFAWSGMALGGWQGGVFYDLCGDYVASFANASLGGVANLMVLALLWWVTVRRPRAMLAVAGSN